MPQRRHARAGIPIEDAPPWVLVLLTGILWLVTFPALVGLLAGWGAWHGEVLRTALAALAVAALVVTGVATRPSWVRPKEPTLDDPRPFFVRFSTWLWTAILLPNVLFGALVLGHDGPPMSYGAVVMLGLLVSTLHALLAGGERLKRWWRARGSAGPTGS